MSGELRQFCYTAGRRVMAGLTQELQIQPNVHYRPTGYNAARVLSLGWWASIPTIWPKSAQCATR